MVVETTSGRSAIASPVAGSENPLGSAGGQRGIAFVYSLRIVLAAFVLTSLALIQGTTAAAASGYTLFGDATLVHPGHNSNTAVQLRSVGATYGGIDFAIPSGMTASQLNNLSTDYKFTAGSCGGGAPRFQINVGGHNIFTAP